MLAGEGMKVSIKGPLTMGTSGKGFASAMRATTASNTVSLDIQVCCRINAKMWEPGTSVAPKWRRTLPLLAAPLWKTETAERKSSADTLGLRHQHYARVISYVGHALPVSLTRFQSHSRTSQEA